jgi:hypothetical protein
LDKDTAKAISWCITKTFYKTFQVNLNHCFDVYPGLRCQCLKGQNTNALCSNDKLIIITAGTEVMDLPAVYKGFKIKIMDVHDKSAEKSESEALSASHRSHQYVYRELNPENEFPQVVIYPLAYSIAECKTLF